jgi:hypothetical protein
MIPITRELVNEVTARKALTPLACPGCGNTTADAGISNWQYETRVTDVLGTFNGTVVTGDDGETNDFDEDFDDDKKEHKQYISYDISEKVGDRKIIVHVRQRETSNGTEYVADVLCRVTTNKDKAVEKIQIKDTDPDRLILKLEIALRQIL